MPSTASRGLAITADKRPDPETTNGPACQQTCFISARRHVNQKHESQLRNYVIASTGRHLAAAQNKN